MGEMNLPERWKMVTLSNQRLFSFENGVWKGKKAPLEKHAVVRNTNFTSDGYLDLTDVAVLQIEQRHLSKKKLNWGDIIIERSGGGPKQPVGRVVFFNLMDGKYYFSNFTSRLRVVDKNTVSPLYLFFYLLHFYASGQTRKLQHGTTGIRNLIFEDYKSSGVPLPPLPEQRAIAHVLQTIQEAKSARQKEIALERERKAALMDYLFSHGTKNEPRKQTEIGEIPESWEVVKLDEVCCVKTSFPSFKKIPEFETPDVVHEVVFALKVSDMNTPANHKYVTESQWVFYCEIQEIKKRRFLKPYSIIFPKRGAAIKTNKKRITTCYSVLDPNLIGVELPTTVDLGYLFGFFERFDLGVLQDNNPIPQLNKKDVEGILISLPPLPEQSKIAEILQACDTKIASLEQEAARLDELFHAMLDELMTGKRSAVPLIDTELP